MRTERDDLIFLVRMSLRTGLSSIRGMKRIPTEEQERRLAEKIISDLESYNWKITLGEPGRPPG